MIEMTIATIGRLIKNLDMAIYLGSDVCGGLAVWLGAVALNGFGLTVMPAFTLWIPSATTLSPGFNPSSMIHCGACPLTDFDRSDLNLVVVADYGHLVTTLQLCHRALGNEQSASSSSL